MQDDAAVKISNSNDFEMLLMNLSRYPERFKELRRRFRTMRFQDAPSRVIYDLVDLAHEALPEEKRPVLKVVGE